MKKVLRTHKMKIDVKCKVCKKQISERIIWNDQVPEDGCYFGFCMTCSSDKSIMKSEDIMMKG